MLDETDRQIAVALMASPRASWRTIAQVLDLSERTIVRRGTTLLRDGTLRPTAVRNPARFARISPLVLRIRCRPNRVGAVAAQLARRPDAVGIGILGGGEISGILFLDGIEARNSLLLRELPAVGGIRSWEAQELLRVFPEGFSWNGGLLTPEQLKALSPLPLPHDPTEPPEIQKPDEALIDQLTVNARAGYGELGDLLDITATTVRRRLEKLLAAHVVRLVCEVDFGLLGMAGQALLRITTGPANLDALGDVLSRHPNVRFTAATTGAANLLVAVAAEDRDALYTFLTRTVGGLDDIRAVEAAPILETHILSPLFPATSTAHFGSDLGEDDAGRPVGRGD